MRTITIIIAIFALGLITGILMIQIPKLANPSPVDTTEPFMVHELPPPHSGVGTTSKYAGEVTKIDGASDEENVAELTHDTTDTDTSVQTLKQQTLPRVRLDVEGCKHSSAAPPQSTINRICSTYTTDGEYVYFHDTRMSADVATFVVYPVSVQQYVSPNTADLLFAHDAYTVYFQDQALVGVTPETFKAVATNGTEDEIRQFKDKVRLLAEQNPSLQRVEIYLGKPVALDKYAYLDELVNRLLILDTNLVPFEDSSVPLERLDDFACSLRVHGDYLVATLNGERLMFSDLGEMYLPGPLPRAWLVDSEKQQETKEKLTGDLIERKLLLADAKSKGVALNSVELKARLISALEGLSGREGVRRRMEHFGLREERYYYLVRDQLLLEKHKQAFITAGLVDPTDEEIVAYYEGWYSKSADPIPLEEVEEEIIRQLEGGQEQVLVDEYVAKLKQSADIEIFAI
jgi:hypothetical protein